MNKETVINKIQHYQLSFSVGKSFFDDIDYRLSEYIEEVLNNPNKHNMYEILSVMRFISFSDKYYFSIHKFNQFKNFYEQLQFPSEKGQMSFLLTPVQIFQFASIYGWYREDGTRVCNDALLYVPRKFSKTTSVAATAIYDLLFGPSDAQAYVASNSFTQAQICFNIISNTLKPLDPKMNYFQRNRDKIYSKIKGKTSFIQCLSSSPDKLDGLNASTIILDEYAAATSAALKNVLTSSQGVRKNPLIITITTASTNLDGPFQVDLANYKKILEGVIQDDSVFASIFEPDEGDDFSSPDTWRKVQPHMGITVNEEFYKRSWAKALRSADDKIEFSTKLLNVFTPPIKADWIDRKIIERNMIHVELERITSRPLCMVAVDLSVKDDFSCVSFGLYDSINKEFTFKNYYYIPRNTIETHANTELYRRWRDEGYLIECGTDVIDYEMIAKDIINKSRYVNILQIRFDSYKNKDLTNYLKASGVKCLVAYNQTYSYFTSPIESFTQAIYENKIKIDDNPINAYCINNAVIDEDNIGNKKIIKYSSSKKIDGAICMLMGLGSFMTYKR